MKPVDLTAHPEGGRFREVFRSARMVTTEGGRMQRSALTHIYFSLKAGEVSKFHRVSSDEVWNLYRGALKLYLWDETSAPPVCIELSPHTNQFCQVVPAGIWQAASPLTDEVLVGCTVAPGFDFADFTMLEPETALSPRLLAVDPAMSRLI